MSRNAMNLQDRYKSPVLFFLHKLYKMWFLEGYNTLIFFFFLIIIIFFSFVRWWGEYSLYLKEGCIHNYLYLNSHCYWGEAVLTVGIFIVLLVVVCCYVFLPCLRCRYKVTDFKNIPIIVLSCRILWCSKFLYVILQGCGTKEGLKTSKSRSKDIGWVDWDWENRMGKETGNFGINY